MNFAFFQGYFVIGVILVIQWRTLKRESRMTRWLAYGLMAFSASIWTYFTNAAEVERPMVWLEKWFHPLNPFH